MEMKLPDITRRLFRRNNSKKDQAKSESEFSQNEFGNDFTVKTSTDEISRVPIEVKFTSSIIDSLIRTICNNKRSQTVRSNDGIVCKVLSTSGIDALSFFFYLDDIHIAQLEKRNVLFDGCALRMNFCSDRYIEFSTLSEKTDDIASITYVENKRKVKHIRFVRKL